MMMTFLYLEEARERVRGTSSISPKAPEVIERNGAEASTRLLLRTQHPVAAAEKLGLVEQVLRLGSCDDSVGGEEREEEGEKREKGGGAGAEKRGRGGWLLYSFTVLPGCNGSFRRGAWRRYYI